MTYNLPKWFRYLAIPLIVVMLNHPVNAQNNKLKFEHLSIADGLSNGTVNCIMQDSRGFMWFGTSDGLNKFDGYNFTTYKSTTETQSSTNSYEVVALMEDSHANIWIATKRSGLNLYDRYTERIANIVPAMDVNHVVEASYVFCIMEGNAGNIWFGTITGLYTYNPQTQTFSKFLSDSSNVRSLSNNSIRCLFEDRKQRLWIGTADGLNLYDRETSDFVRYLTAGTNETPMDIRGIYEDANGQLWLSVYFGGLICFDPDKNTVKLYLHNNGDSGTISTNQLFCIAGDDQGKLYIGTENGGLNIFNIQTEEFSQYVFNVDDEKSINSNSIYSIYVGNNGMLWLGTFNGGINYTSNQSQGFHHYKVTQGGLNNPYILSIAEDRYRNLWIGTDGGGLNVLDQKTGHYQHYMHDKNDPSSLSANEVTAVFIDSYDQIWVGTYRGGLDLFDPQSGTFTHSRNDPADSLTIRHNFIQTIFEDRDRNLYIGSFTGLDQYNRKTKTFRRFNYPIIQDGVLSMLEDSRGNLWIGTYQGLSFVDKKGYTVINYIHDFNDETCAVPDICYALWEDRNGHVWVGAAKGLFRFDKTEQRFVRYQTSDGLPNNYVAGIAEDRQGNLWLNAGQQILKMAHATQFSEKPIFTSFGIHEGVKGLYLSKSGDIYFGGNNGLNVFSPDRMTQNPYIPPVVLTNLKIFNKDVPIGIDDSPLKQHITETTELTLAHRQSVFTFEFAALNYIFPEKNQYAFIMDGFEKEWNYVRTQRSATYTNLDPGEYVFRVRGSNNDGVWNETGAAIRIKIIPPWWQTSWTYMVYILTFFGVLFSIWRFQLNKARMKHELALEHLHAEKLEEINRMKSRFFSNVTHEFRTPLTLIMGPIQQVFAGDLTGQFKDQCKMIIRNSRKLYQLINQLLDLSKLEAGHMPLQTRKENIVALLKDHVVSFSALAERKHINLQFSVLTNSHNGSDAIDVYLDQDKFEKIIYNLLSNAIKFTPEDGEIRLYVQKFRFQSRFSNIVELDQEPTRHNKMFTFLKSAFMLRTDNQRNDATNTMIVKFPHGFVEIIISDNGIGCPEESIDKIFDRFYEVDDARYPRHEGTGIGLALTKELVELHSGTISVESAYGKGSTFTVRLPLGRDHLKDNQIIQEPAFSEQGDMISIPEMDEIQDDHDTDDLIRTKLLSRRKLPMLLIVEDNADFRDYLNDCLHHDYLVISARDGKEGLEKAIERIPDLIVSDVMMPEMNGFDLCHQVKTDERTSHIPVILLTAKASGESKIEGLETGADDYVVKPFEIKELKARIRNLIDQRRQLRLRFNRKEGLKPEEIATTSADEKFLHKALTIIEQKMSDPDFSVEEFAKDIALSRVQLHRKLRSLTGQSTSEFIRVVRLNRAAQLLKQNHESITQIAFLVGFNSSSYFSRSFIKHFGVSPSDYVSAG
ncbi:response regulator [candidate division KSB1 bacterium]|nr:response regulator [candidate division KSB1 bacterium]